MKITILDQSYDTDKMNKYEKRALVSKIKSRLRNADVVESIAQQHLDGVKLKEIATAKDGLNKILTILNENQ